jgi:hypothetical protein
VPACHLDAFSNKKGPAGCADACALSPIKRALLLLAAGWLLLVAAWRRRPPGVVAACCLACFALLALPSLPLVASATSTLPLRSDAEKNGWE